MKVVTVSLTHDVWWRNFYMNLYNDSAYLWWKLGSDGRVHLINTALKRFHASYDVNDDSLTFDSDEWYTWFILKWS